MRRVPLRSLRRRQLARRWEPRLEALMRSRPGWDETWIAVARLVAQRSRCDRAQVGAVIVSPRNRIVSVGYNSPPPGFESSWIAEQCRLRAFKVEELPEHCSEFCPRAMSLSPDVNYEDCCSVHAESNALMVCDEAQRVDGTLYVTGEICVGCARQIGNSRLKRVVISPDGVDRSYRRPERVRTLIRSYGIVVDEV